VTDRITDEPISRRTVTALATAGISLPVLAACGDEGSTATDSPSPSSPSSDASSASAEPSSKPTKSPSAGGGDGLASTSDIEVGGGTIFGDEGVVITQPTEGEFRGFDATCTHQGCQVSSVSDGSIHCVCHHSQFSIEDGSPEAGPATSPLEEVAIRVEGDQIQLA